MKRRRGCRIGCLVVIALGLVVLGGTWFSCARMARVGDLYGGILHNDVAEVRRALARGADPNAVRPPNMMDLGGDTPIFMEAFVPRSMPDDPTGSPRLRPEIVALLLEHGADPNYRDRAGGTPLNIVCHQTYAEGTPEIVDILLAHGADPNARDFDGYTPLHLCINTSGYLDERTPEVVDRLLAYLADPNARDYAGRTPLHMAAGRYGSNPSVARQVITALLRYGADINARDNEGRTPLDYIGMTGGSHIEDGISFMKQHGAVSGTGPFWGPSR
ncbi:MAG TPA: ankyrin repeat domain-containing protein [Armatimonadota bacterium]|nr:ankyrin repeat domain-containing protein [Armatimonadota bacterium]